MIDTTVQVPTPIKNYRLKWLKDIFIRPRITINQIANQANGIWLLPLVTICLAGIVYILTAGWFKQLAAQSGQVQLPPDFQYYLPEQQERFMQAIAATSGPAFVYVLPALARLITIIIGWLLVGNLLHLILTMFGGRSTTTSILNLTAWSGLPFALRDMVRTIALLFSHQLIRAPGISGFAPAGSGYFFQYMVHLLGLIDIYLILHVVFLGIGARTIAGLSARKAWIGVLITILIVIGFQALVGFGISQISSIQVVRPFFY
jgi:hypothetical protein